MACEVERKFLVVGLAWKQLAPGVLVKQGYLSSAPERIVRVRAAGDRGFLTIKGQTKGIERAEFEYSIPVGDANRILDTLAQRPLIEKHRYTIPYGGHTWEVDEFLGDNAGLVVAEVELESANEKIDPPEWIGSEVSHDPRYFNSNLIANPHSSWPKEPSARNGGR